MTQAEVAQRVSKSRPVVANALRLLSLPESLLKKLEKGEISVGSARTLLSLENEEQMLSAAATITEGGLTVRGAEKLIKKLKNVRTASGKKQNIGVVVDYVEELETRLTKVLGRRIRIIEGKQKGRIEIEYYDRDDFERLYEMLSSLRG